MEQSPNLQHYLATKRHLVEQALDLYLPATEISPSLLHESMRYSVFGGGKRLRPILLLMAAELCGKAHEDVLFAAAAIEMIHTYSLIHDDLPAMDDDDLRRGQPTNHRKYGEAIAILAGDALLTLAFQVMTDPTHGTACPAGAILQATCELGQAVGSIGMIGGQVLDIHAEQRLITPENLESIHALKTGKLLAVSLRIGAILAGASDSTLNALTEYGVHIGLAFQIVDDILDIEGNEIELGKTIQSDINKQKATYPALYGLDESKTRAQHLIHKAKSSVNIFGEKAIYFHQLADFIITRAY